MEKPERIAKVIARAGICSRRDAERFIAEGKVAVDGKVLTSPALNVTASQYITVEGVPIEAPQAARLWLYHKPRGLITTHKDPQGRPTVFETLPDTLPRVISIGRLDVNSEGLLLLTNDGTLARHIELPATGWMRRYRVRLSGTPSAETLEKLARGVEVAGVRYGPVEAIVDRSGGYNSWMTLGLREGKNREIRKLMEHFGHTVSRLIRVAYGPFQLGNLPRGEVKEVSRAVLAAQLGNRFELPAPSRKRR